MQAYRDQYASLFRSGQDIVLISISTDRPQAQYEWARDDQFQFLFASDPDAEVGRAYGAFQARRDGSFINNRTVFIVNDEGVIEWVAAPFREVDPTAYEELAAALEEIAPPSDDDM